MFNKILKGALIFAAGMIGGMVYIDRKVNDGDVIYEDDKIYVKAESDHAYGYSYARVNYKNSNVNKQKD